MIVYSLFPGSRVKLKSSGIWSNIIGWRYLRKILRRKHWESLKKIPKTFQLIRNKIIIWNILPLSPNSSHNWNINKSHITQIYIQNLANPSYSSSNLFSGQRLTEWGISENRKYSRKVFKTVNGKGEKARGDKALLLSKDEGRGWSY